MDMNFPPHVETFRREVRHWFETAFPQDIIAKYKSGTPLTTADIRRSEMALGAKGWLAAAWP
ncbi:MAG: acyl-CoA dehydrogenase, partial [Hyphomonas sp.]